MKSDFLEMLICNMTPNTFFHVRKVPQKSHNNSLVFNLGLFSYVYQNVLRMTHRIRTNF